jgi:hypothetical protein
MTIWRVARFDYSPRAGMVMDNNVDALAPLGIHDRQHLAIGHTEQDAPLARWVTRARRSFIGRIAGYFATVQAGYCDLARPFLNAAKFSILEHKAVTLSRKSA